MNTVQRRSYGGGPISSGGGGVLTNGAGVGETDPGIEPEPSDIAVGGKFFLNRGRKVYEMKNHLGNVLAVVSDVKIGQSTSSMVSYYAPDIVEMTDYYPFGMQMIKRHYVADAGYRFGFNGKENDDEWNGSGNMLDYGFRVHDPRLGRFLSVDPLAPNYPWYTPYQYAGNTPIAAIDLDGLEEYIVVYDYNLDEKTCELKLANSSVVNSHRFVYGYIGSPSSKWMEEFKNGNVNWLFGKDEYFAKKKEVAEYKGISIGRFSGAKQVGSHFESIPQGFGTLYVNRITDKEGNVVTVAGFTPDYQSQAIISGLEDVFYGSLTIVGSGVSELLSGGTLSEVSIPALVYGMDQAIGGVITLSKVANGDYSNEAGSTDNKLLRATFKYVGGDGGEMVYDIGSIMVNASGAFKLTTSQSNDFRAFVTDLGSVEQLGESLKKDN